ncbi:MAG TPA: hypothetical protein VIA02_10390 [Candidatus Limnocylindria bacterium]
MAVIATVFGILGRFAGKVLTMSLGWASTLLFGRVSQDRQVFLAAITFGAVIWVVLVVGVVVPEAGTMLLAFLPIPEWVEEGWVRLAMLAGAIALPAVIGVASTFLVKAEDRSTGVKAIVVQVLRGYPLTAGLALMLVFLAAIGLVRKGSSLLRRRTDAHIPIVLKPGGYEGLVDDLDGAISSAGVDVEETDAPAVLVVPGRLLASVAGAQVRALLPDRLVQLKGKGVEVLIYPSDVAISGEKTAVAKVQAAVASRLTTADAWMTMTEDGQEIEDLLASLAKSGPSEPERAAILADVDHRLSNRDIPYDEWEILFRERLQVERDLLTGTRPGTASPANPNGGGRRFSVGRVATGAAVAVGLALTVLNGAMVVVEARESARENKREARRR